MKVVKTRLCNIMEDDRLRNLLVEYIVKEITEKFNVDAIINKFNTIKMKKSCINIFFFFFFKVNLIFFKVYLIFTYYIFYYFTLAPFSDTPLELSRTTMPTKLSLPSAGCQTQTST